MVFTLACRKNKVRPDMPGEIVEESKGRTRVRRNESRIANLQPGKKIKATLEKVAFS